MYGTMLAMNNVEIIWPETLCNDGWVSRSSGPGTCSHHGGVNYNANQDASNIGWGWLVVCVAVWVIAIAWWKS
jgi:hypothetical protein